jgi:hypothetical protein
MRAPITRLVRRHPVITFFVLAEHALVNGVTARRSVRGGGVTEALTPAARLNGPIRSDDDRSIRRAARCAPAAALPSERAQR